MRTVAASKTAVSAAHRQLFVLLAMIIGSGIVILDGSVVTLALPNIAHNLHASFADLQWVVDGYLLTLSGLLLLGGSLEDIFGRKRMYMIGLTGFGLSSLLCGVAPNITALIALRIIQGVFGALLVPGALAIIDTTFPPQTRGQAIGRWAAWSGIAAAVGPVLGGYLITVASWRWIFFMNVPLVLACVPLALVGIKEKGREHQARRVDVADAALSSLALAGITYGLIEGPAQHWNIRTIVILIAAVLLFVAFLVRDARKRDPLVPLRLFKSRNFTGANAATFAMYGALGGFFFALIIYLQTTLGYTSLQAGLSTLPVTAILFALSGMMGKLTSKYGPRLFMTAGPLTAALGIALLAFLGQGDRYVTNILPGIMLFGLGLALTVTPLTTAVMAAVSEKDSGIASGVNNAISRVASLIVVALLGLLGTAHVYRFAVAACVVLTAAAGILSFVLIRNARAT